MREPAVYIMASRRNGTLYTCVTSDLIRAAPTSTAKAASPGFTRRYGCKQLVWFERYDLITDAIAREKQIKAGSRANKMALIETLNPQWRDLYLDLNA